MFNPYAMPQFQAQSQNNPPQYVNSRQSVEIMPMQPNQEAIFFDSTKDTFYRASTDAAGVKNIIECEYVIVTPESKASDYVSRTEFEELKNKIDEMMKKGAEVDE